MYINTYLDQISFSYFGVLLVYKTVYWTVWQNLLSKRQLYDFTDRWGKLPRGILLISTKILEIK